MSARMRGKREGRERARRDLPLTARTGARAVRVCGIAVSIHYAPARARSQNPERAYSPRISRRRRFRAVIRSFIFSDSADARVFRFAGAGGAAAGLAT